MVQEHPLFLTSENGGSGQPATVSTTFIHDGKLLRK